MHFNLFLPYFTAYDSVATKLLPCFSVFAFQIFKRIFNRNFLSRCTKCWCGNRRVAFGAWLLVQLLQPLLSATFAAQSERKDFFGFFRLAAADENEHDLFFFSKAFGKVHLIWQGGEWRYWVGVGGGGGGSENLYSVELRFNEPLFNEVLVITNEILRPGQSYSKMYGII